MKEIYFVDQMLQVLELSEEELQELKDEGMKNTIYFAAYNDAVNSQSVFSLSDEEAKKLCKIMSCNSVDELEGAVVTTVVKVVYGSMDASPVVVAVGKDGYFVQIHDDSPYVDDDDWYSSLYTKKKKVKIETEADLIKKEYRSYMIKRTPLKCNEGNVPSLYEYYAKKEKSAKTNRAK